MSAPKAGTYVLVATAFYRTEGEGDDAVRRRYKRGDEVELSKAEAARLAVATRLAPAAFVKAGEVDNLPPGPDLATAPPATVNRESEANQLQAEANSGLTPGDSAPTVADGKPPKSATVEVWRDYAVNVGAVAAEEAGGLTKAQLQQAVADHERNG
ncbi:hypothetical protein [Mycolicibacterium mageritense]|uniref:hypothetical protein n=1 Tax=Mycolicibacterium mageritense TaxID=53462 RepID=UPI001E5CC36E|nr:hypothetical protein [Mycolicibacterium mageritense]GJJ23730.1 hypothetical protein MTY414_74030 [Mycolicibacterium mageritense]